MDIEQLRDYCLTKPDAEETFPFGPDNIVYKVAAKMFLLLPLDTQPVQFNAKCDPEKALELREKYACVQPGYHMNKKHWNTVMLDGTLSWQQVKEMVDESYQLVAPGKKKKQFL